MGYSHTRSSIHCAIVVQSDTQLNHSPIIDCTMIYAIDLVRLIGWPSFPVAINVVALSDSSDNPLIAFAVSGARRSGRIASNSEFLELLHIKVTAA